MLRQPLELIQENAANVGTDLCVAVVQTPPSSYKAHQHSVKNFWEVPRAGCVTVEGEVGAQCDRN